ncbi:MAG: hypothetical protein ABI765_12265 [Gemmatimonadota bacterium]
MVSELRSMALRDPGVDKPALSRAAEICSLLRGVDPAGRHVGTAGDRACAQLEILLSNRRWKTEVSSVEALRKEIKSACDRLRVAVEAALHDQAARPVR